MDNQKPILIFSIKYGYYISKTIQYLLKINHIESEIVHYVDPTKDNLYIILFSHKVPQFPKNYIVYQLEQKDICNRIDQKYILSIVHSKKTWDYTPANIIRFEEYVRKKMVYFPIPLIDYQKLVSYPLQYSNQYDVLFYGTMNGDRISILEYIKKQLPYIRLRVIDNMFEDQLFREICKSRIVLNIHFYQNANLETARLNEILSCKKLPISFYPSVYELYHYQLYKDQVIFVKNINEMIQKIQYYLSHPVEYQKIIDNIKFTPEDDKIISFLEK